MPHPIGLFWGKTFLSGHAIDLTVVGDDPLAPRSLLATAPYLALEGIENKLELVINVDFL
jgi:hypothetical protein